MRRPSRDRLTSLLHRLRRRPWADWRQVGPALVVTLGMWAAVRVVSIRRLLAWTDAPPPSGPSTAPNDARDTDREGRILWAVGAVNRRLFPDRPCLTQALAARYLLARRGVATRLHIGVARGDGGVLSAHAWLERDGRVLIGGDQSRSRYQVLAGPEASARRVR